MDAKTRSDHAMTSGSENRSAALAGLSGEAGDGTRTRDPQLGRLTLGPLTCATEADAERLRAAWLAGYARCQGFTDLRECRDGIWRCCCQGCCQDGER